MVEIEVDVKILQRRLEPLAVADLRPLAGGASSLSYLATATVDGAPRQIVVKVAPAGLPPVRNRDVLRQARVLRLLAGTDVPVPEVVFEDPGAPPGIPPLFAMSFVEGVSVEPLFDRDGTDDAEVVGRRLHDAARVLARLHALDPGTLGLDDEPYVGPADEVARWSRLLETVDAALVPGWERAADGLHATEPPAMRSALVHGDFRLGNLLAEGPTLTAIIDWEIWSIGDPRVDLGWFLVNADPDTYGRSTPYVGLLPTPPELVRTYTAATQSEVPALEWFCALACFKSAATWALIVKHNRRRADPDPTTEEIANALPDLLLRAARLLGA